MNEQKGFVIVKISMNRTNFVMVKCSFGNWLSILFWQYFVFISCDKVHGWDVYDGNIFQIDRLFDEMSDS